MDGAQKKTGVLKKTKKHQLPSALPNFAPATRRPGGCKALTEEAGGSIWALKMIHLHGWWLCEGKSHTLGRRIPKGVGFSSSPWDFLFDILSTMENHMHLEDLYRFVRGSVRAKTLALEGF